MSTIKTRLLAGVAVLPLLAFGAQAAPTTVNNLTAAGTVNGVDTIPYCQGCGAGVDLKNLSITALTSYLNGAAVIPLSSGTSGVLPSTRGGFGSISGLGVANGAGIVSQAVNGVNFSLITALTCASGQHISALTAAGVGTCTADAGGAGGGSFGINDTYGNSFTGITTLSLAPGLTVSGAGANATIKPTVDTVDVAGTTYTVSPTDANRLIHFTSTLPVTVTMLDRATAGAGFGVAFKFDGGGTINRQGSSTDTLNGITSVAVGPYQTVAVLSQAAAGSFGVAFNPGYNPADASNLTLGHVANAQGGAGSLTGVLNAVSGTVGVIPKSGSGTTLASVTGTPTNGNCASWNAGNVVDAGGPCTTGGGGGTVSAGVAGQIGRYAANGTVISGDGTLTDDGAILTIAQGLAISPELSPTALTGQTNDYAPTGFGTTQRLAIDPGTGGNTLTGLSGGAVGRVVTIRNRSATDTLTISHANSASLSANQFILPADVHVPPLGAREFVYSSLAGGWVEKNAALSDTGVTPGTYTSVTVGFDGRVTAGSNPSSGGGGSTAVVADGTSPNLVFTGLTAANTDYAISCAVRPDTAGADINIQFSNDGGSTWLTSNYRWVASGGTTAGGTSFGNSDSDAGMKFRGGTALSNSFYSVFNFRIFGPADAIYHRISGTAFFTTSTLLHAANEFGGGYVPQVTTPVNAIRMSVSTGLIIAGSHCAIRA